MAVTRRSIVVAQAVDVVEVSVVVGYWLQTHRHSSVVVVVPSVVVVLVSVVAFHI